MDRTQGGKLVQMSHEQYEEEIKKGTINVLNTSIDSQSFNIKKYSKEKSKDVKKFFQTKFDLDSFKILKIVREIFIIKEKNQFNVFVNGDARGYALKLKSEFIKDKTIHRDWGGYGIIAPDFREGA